jgi:phage terminase Nu1 subunit (DNA packaging protein)
MGSNQISELRHLEIKIEYYNMKIASCSNKISDDDVVDLTIKIARYKLMKQLLLLIQDVEKLQAGEIDLADIISIGGAEGLRKNAKMIKELIDTVNNEERRLYGDVDEDDIMNVSFDNRLKVVQGKLNQIKNASN